MKEIAVRLNKTVEYEVFFKVPEGTCVDTIYELAKTLESADLEQMDVDTPDDKCKMIALYNDMLDWREVTQ